MQKLSDYGDHEVQKARSEVVEDWKQIVRKIRKDDDYAKHITETEKNELLKKGLKFAGEIACGAHDANFTVWQRIIFKLSGENITPF